MLGVSDRSNSGVLPSSRLPAASINAVRVKRGGPGQGRASGERSERSLDAAERFHTIRTSKRRRAVFIAVSELASMRAGLAEAVVPMRVTDDEVIEQGQVEDVGRGAQPQRQSRIVRTRCGIAARMVVNHHQAGRARCETRGHEDIWHGHWRAGARAARQHMPGEQAVLGRQTRDAEDFDRLIGNQRREDRRRGAGSLRTTVGTSTTRPSPSRSGPVAADEFSDAVTAGGRRRR